MTFAGNVGYLGMKGCLVELQGWLGISGCVVFDQQMAILTNNNRKLKGNEQKAEKWIKKRTKPCPRCGTPIMKNAGCNHVACQICQYHFCWLCRYYFRFNLIFFFVILAYHYQHSPLLPSSREPFGGYSHYTSGKCKGKLYYKNPAKKAAVYVGMAAGSALALCVVIPLVPVVLPVYGAYRLYQSGKGEGGEEEK